MLLDLKWKAFVGAVVAAVVLKAGLGVSANGVLVFAVAFVALIAVFVVAAAVEGWWRERRSPRPPDRP